MESLSNELKQFRGRKNQVKPDKEILDSIKEAYNVLYELEEKGLTKPRGYTLMTIDNIPRVCKYQID
jgi:hypothetical protein